MNHHPRLIVWIAATALVLVGTGLAGKGDDMTDLDLNSSVFRQGESIPARYTCQGEDVSPPLSIEGVPDDAKSLALIMEDPDAPAGTWDHWILYGLSPGSSKIPEGMVPPGAKEGQNSWDDAGWGGPCPPEGEEHRYFFRLYALDTELDMGPGASKHQLRDAMEGHILAEAELMGRYQKS